MLPATKQALSAHIEFKNWENYLLLFNNAKNKIVQPPRALDSLAHTNFIHQIKFKDNQLLVVSRRRSKSGRMTSSVGDL